MNNLFLLLKVHLNDELRISVFFHEKNKLKKLGFVMKNMVFLCLLIGLVSVCYMAGKQLVIHELGEAIPIIGYILGSILSLLITVLKINEILAGRSDAEYVMSLPMGTFLHVFCIFLRLYVWNTALVALTNVPLILPFLAETTVSGDFLARWVIGLFFTCLPLTGIASLLGTVLALALSSSRKSNLIQSCITLGMITFAGIALLRIYYSAGQVIRHAGDAQSVISAVISNFRSGRFYQSGIVEGSIGYLALFFGYSCIWFLFFVFLLSMSYQEVIIALRSPKDYIEYHYVTQNQIPLKQSVEKRLWSQWLHSRTYMTSTLIGPIYAVLISFFFMITSGNGMRDYLAEQGITGYLGIPILLCLLLGMGCNTYCGLSMEGRCHWISEIIPVDSKEICQSKIRMNLKITVPVALLCGLMLWFAFLPPVWIAWTYLVVPVGYGVLSSVWGMLIDKKHCNYTLDTENQVLFQSISFYLGWLPAVVLPGVMGACLLIG